MVQAFGDSERVQLGDKASATGADGRADLVILFEDQDTMAVRGDRFGC